MELPDLFAHEDNIIATNDMAKYLAIK